MQICLYSKLHDLKRWVKRGTDPVSKDKQQITTDIYSGSASESEGYQQGWQEEREHLMLLLLLARNLL